MANFIPSSSLVFHKTINCNNRAGASINIEAEESYPCEALYDAIKQYHDTESLVDNLPDVNHPKLIPVLRPYQIRAVKWMLSMELSEDCAHQENEFTRPRGGILADEMGLGKTVEMLACILANPWKERLKSSACFENTEIKSSDMDPGFAVSCRNLLTEVKDDVLSAVDLKHVHHKADNISMLPPLGSKRQCSVSPSRSVSCKSARKNNKHSIANRAFDTTITEVIEKYCYNRESPPPLLKGKEELLLLSTSKSVSCGEAADRTIDEELQRYSSSGKLSEGPQGSGRKGQTLKLLQQWYEQKLAEVKPRVSRRSLPIPELRCFCWGAEECELGDRRVCCVGCSTWQHAVCVGLTDTESLPPSSYFCPLCLQQRGALESGATVIVSPAAICDQWVDEIEKHIRKPSPQVLVYRGVRATGYIQPSILATYDIVVITYQVLCKELNYIPSPAWEEGDNGRRLRHTKRFHVPISPLTSVRWWRLCLDEAQMVEGSTSRTAEMARRLTAVNKWAITGTPVQKSVHDLFGLMQFLAISPYGMDRKAWLALTAEPSRLAAILVQVMWRSAKCDVYAQLGVPAQGVQDHWLRFSPVEAHFYGRQHRLCSLLFTNTIRACSGLATSAQNDRCMYGRY